MNSTFNESTGLTQCEAERLTGYRSLDEHTENILRHSLVGFVIGLFPFAIALNSLAIFLILRFKHLHQTTFFLALQLLIVDLGNSLVATTLRLVSALSGQWIMGLGFCKFTGTVLPFLFSMRYALMFIFVCDRFCTVFLPLHYPKFRSKVVWSLYVAALVVIAILGVSLLSLDCIVFSRDVWFCAARGGCTHTKICQTISLGKHTAFTILGGLIPSVMYIIIFIKAKKIQNKINQIPKSDSDELEEQRKREKRANKTFLFLFLSTFTIGCLPYLLRFWLQGNTLPFIIVRFLLVIAGDFLPIVDPLTIFRNSDVRKAMKVLKSNYRRGTL